MVITLNKLTLTQRQANSTVMTCQVMPYELNFLLFLVSDIEKTAQKLYFNSKFSRFLMYLGIELAYLVFYH